MDQYLKRDIAKIIGRSPRTIKYWTDLKLVVPDIVPPQGRGVAQIYSDRNLIEFCIIDRMVTTIGVPLAIIGTILESLRSGRYGETEFEDFYQDHDKWGQKRELIFAIDYILKEQIGKKNPEIDVFDVAISKDGATNLATDLLYKFLGVSYRDSLMIYKLCRIKLDAIENAGLTFLLS